MHEAHGARIRNWRLKAAELRAVADNMKDPAARIGMLNAAATYETLADEAEGGQSWGVAGGETAGPTRARSVSA